MANRLANETSPYLRQHADNPVDWYPWGDQAFEAARDQDRPVFLSVGYSSCHWCHVMAHESFEDPETAALVNELFVNVKVDREERPDVDAVYMDAVQALTGRGGWPMSVWLQPDGRPFYAGTYYPRHDQPGMPAFTTVCRAVGEAWRDRRDQVDDQAGQLHRALSGSVLERAREVGSGVEVSLSSLDEAAQLAIGQFDPRHGGFGGAPKFPHAMMLGFLASHFARSRNAQIENVLRTSLDAMAAGGIYDHVGGGFARYSVDDHWLVPHFEKMLYDQALLVRAYTRAWLAVGEPRWREVVEATIGYVLRDLRHADGGFYSAEDADSEGEEGRFYVWSIDEVRAVCGSDAPAVIDHFAVSEAGNFEGRNILAARNRTADKPEAVQRGLRALYDARVHRVRPQLDDKVLTEWNALFLRALVEAAFAFGREDWMRAARENGQFILERLRRADGRLLRSWQAGAESIDGSGSDGRARHLGYAADHGALLEALVTLAELDDLRWLDDADSVASALVELFFEAGQGAFYSTGSDAEALVVRPLDLQDNATPSANALAVSGLLRLAHITGERRYDDVIRPAIEAIAPLAVAHPLAFGHGLEALERWLSPPVEVVLVGERDHPATAALREVVASRLLPTATIVQWPASADRGVPLLEGRMASEQPTAFVCESYACRQPVTSADALAAMLESLADQRSS